MVSKDEIIQQLIEKNIILCVADKYILTEKYKDLLELDIKMLPTPEIKEPPKIDRDKLLDGTTNGSDWPVEVLESKGRARASYLITLCEIPTTSSDGRYRLIGLDNEAINIIGNIVENSDIIPKDFIECVKDYYLTIEHPKAFKNFLKEEFTDVYLEWIQGTNKPSKGTRKWS